MTTWRDRFEMTLGAISLSCIAYVICLVAWQIITVEAREWDRPQREWSYSCQERAYGGEVCGWYR